MMNGLISPFPDGYAIGVAQYYNKASELQILIVYVSVLVYYTILYYTIYYIPWAKAECIIVSGCMYNNLYSFCFFSTTDQYNSKRSWNWKVRD